MTEEVGQSYGGGEITVSTEELNPALQRIWFEKAEIVEYPLYENGKVIYGVVVDLSTELPDRLVITIKNEGDENLDYWVKAYIDGNKILDTAISDQPVGEISKVGVTVASAGFGIGEHTCEWFVKAKRAGAPFADYRTYHSKKVTYSCYTKAMNAICTEVVMVQEGEEKHWLTGTPEGFTESEVAILPDVETHFKFYLSNPGDEAVKMNVGHVIPTAAMALPQTPLYCMSKVNGEWKVIKGEPVRSNYDSGFMVGGVLLDTIEKNVAMPAGETSEITTQHFIPSPGVLTIGDIAILRAFHIILPECEQEFRVYDRQGNPIPDGWTLVAEIYEEDGETLMEVRTKPVVNGACVVSVPEDRYVRVWAEKDDERTTSWGLGPGILCTPTPYKLYQHITCDEAEHYLSGRALLEHYDTDSDGVLTQAETVQAILDGLDDIINIAEMVFVYRCYEDYSGVINDMCPPS